MISAKVIEDSVWGSRITTMQLHYPLLIHAELLTHRTFARNSRSTRAVPVKRMIREVISDPFVPVHFGKNQKGMVAKTSGANPTLCRWIWHTGRWVSILQAKAFAMLGVHKQHANRVLTPYLWINTVITATDTYADFNPWQAFFSLRTALDAQPEMRELALRMQEAYTASEPKARKEHMPFVDSEERARFTRRACLRISAMRCARVSIFTPGEVSARPERDILRSQELQDAHHWSPFEHPAIRSPGSWGCYRGWKSARVKLQEPML